MERKLRKLLTLTLVSAFLLAGFGEQAHAVVLCFGADGHAALEMETDGRCAPSSFAACFPDSEARSGYGKTVIEGGSVDPCLDYCLSFAGESIRKHKDLPNLLSIGLAAASPSVHPVTGVLHPKLSLSDIPPPYRAAVALRTIVLLI